MKSEMIRVVNYRTVPPEKPARREPTEREMREFLEDVELAAEELRLAEGDVPVLVVVQVRGDGAAVSKDRLLPLLRGDGVQAIRHPDRDTRAFVLGAEKAAGLVERVFGKGHAILRRMRANLADGLPWGEYYRMAFEAELCYSQVMEHGPSGLGVGV